MNQHLTFISLYTTFLAEGGTVEESEGTEGTETGSEAAVMKQGTQGTS